MIRRIDGWPKALQMGEWHSYFSFFFFLDSGVLGRIPRFCALRWPWLVSWFGEGGGQDHKMWMELCLTVYPEIVAEIVLEIIMREGRRIAYLSGPSRPSLHVHLSLEASKTVDLPQQSTHVGVVCIY